MNIGANTFSLVAASEWWVTRWLTPFWIFGVGVLGGLILLAILCFLIYAFSMVPLLDRWRRNGAAFWIGAVGGLLLTIGISFPLKALFQSRLTGQLVADEWWLSLPAIWGIMSVILWCILYCSNRRFLSEFAETLQIGVGFQIFATLLTIVCLAFAATFVVEEPIPMLTSLPRLFSTGTINKTVTLAGVPVDSDAGEFLPVELSYNPLALRRITILSDRNVVLNVISSSTGDYADAPTRIIARTPLEWNRGSAGNPPIPTQLGEELRAQNMEIDPAEITFLIETAAERPEMFAALVLAGCTFLLGTFWFLQWGAAPRLAAIAMATSKSEISQPLPKILMIFAGLCIAAFVFVPFHTLGEDIKLLKDCGVTLIMVVCLFQGIWSASSSVSDEIEGRTALTLLSKPIRRRSFIFGKLLGILWVLVLMVLILGAIELLAVGYKPIYDARENSQEMPLWQQGYVEMFRTLPGIIMVLFQVTTLTSLAVALATRLPQLANFAVCFSIYLIGHLTPSIVSSSQDAFPIVQFVAQLIAVLTPNLDLFSMNGAIDANTPIPGVYIAGLLIYSLLFCGLATLMGLLLFEDRDLA